MYLPFLNNDNKGKQQLIDFKGYNHNLVANDGEFYDMKNLTSSYYPVLSTRDKRATLKTFARPNGLFAKEKLAYVDGVDFYYSNTHIGTVSDTEKQFASMGAYLLIFPDKKIYNTFTGDFNNLEESYTGADISFTTNTIVSTANTFNFNQYDGIKVKGSLIETNNKTVIIRSISEDKKTLTVDDNVFKAEAVGASITLSRDVPTMDFITAHENRLWGCSSEKHEIYASKLGDPYNWNCFEGISTDSYAATVGTDGDFTGACTHLGNVLFFKEDVIHKIYGSKPSNYQLYSNFGRGLAKGSEKSLTIVNETLFYRSRNDVVSYGGSIPESVSTALGTVSYKDAVAGSVGDKYYISMMDSSSVWHLFVFDYTKGIWHREDNTHVLYFAYLEGKLFYVDADTKELKLVSNTGFEAEETEIYGEKIAESTIEWNAETGDMSENSIDKKHISKIQVNVELEEGSTFEVYIKIDDGLWEKKYSITSTVKSTYNIPIIPRRCDHFNIKFAGIGSFKLFSMSKTIEGGSEV